MKQLRTVSAAAKAGYPTRARPAGTERDDADDEADVSAMVIGDTVQLDSVTPPEGVKFVADAPEEITIATLNPPRVVEEEPEVEEDTEIVGEGEAEGEETAGEDSGGDEGDSDSED